MSAIDEVRLAIGDTDVSNALLTDSELNVFIARYSSTGGTASTNVHWAAADACDALAARFARDFDFAEDGQTFSPAARALAYREQAAVLRRRAGAGGVDVPIISGTAIT